MIYETTLKVPHNRLDYIKHALEEPDYMGEDDTITDSVTFPNGMQMDIKCCGSQDDVAWTEAVLFNKDGVPEAISDVSDEFLGEWELTDGEGTTYRVTVVPLE